MDESRQPALIDQILKREQALCKTMSAGTPEPWLDLDLTMAQLKTCFVLASGAGEPEAGGLRISDLARRLGVSAPTASTLVDRLVERGLIDRREDPQDRRQHRCRLTPEGQRLLGRIFEAGRARTRRLLGELNEDDLGLVLRGIELLLQAANRLAAADRLTPSAAEIAS
jgi:DNA-binding MarR family transcriptional regulator